jgi:hypothetical protein
MVWCCKLKEFVVKSCAIATVLAISAFSVSAGSQLVQGEIYPPVDNTATSSKTRAEVLAELRAAQAAGTVAHGEFAGRSVVASPSTSKLTRAEVQMELADLARDGKPNPFNSSQGLYRNRSAPHERAVIRTTRVAFSRSSGPNAT